MESATQLKVFHYWKNDEYFTIHVPIENKHFYYLYTPLFEKYHYDANGFFWESFIIQILERIDRKLIGKIEFDPETDAFYAHTHSEKAVHRFIRLLEPIFNDLYRLENYLKHADRNRINY